MPVSEQSKTLSQKLRGHYSYYGVTGNGPALEIFTTKSNAFGTSGCDDVPTDL